jgi:hypothetical protein
MLGVLLFTAACGEGLVARVDRAMDGCLAVRNPLFTQGAGEQAVATLLPSTVGALAERTAYEAGLRMYKGIAEVAGTQADLTCAMELASYYKHQDTRDWLMTFLKHPNAPVVVLAKRLVADQNDRMPQ